jgi:hypothetical protein
MLLLMFERICYLPRVTYLLNVFVERICYLPRELNQYKSLPSVA